MSCISKGFIFFAKSLARTRFRRSKISYWQANYPIYANRYRRIS
ncbi:hypothetical protein ACQ7BN_00790 [Streptococcus suis]